MHRILYYSGIFTGSITFIISFIIWFKLGIRKAFKDTINYGSKKRWSVDAGMQNKTMPLRKTGSGRLFAGKAVRKINDYSVQNKHKEIAETVAKIAHLRAEIDKIVEELSHGK